MGMPHSRDTVLEIDLGALAHNYQQLREKLKPETRFMGVVKAYAYGSDALAVAGRLEALGADYLAVAFTEEGVFLRQNGIRLPILVLHPQPGDLKTLIPNCLEPNLYSFRILELFGEEARRQGQKHYPVHLKFNTGLNRLGFKPETWGTVLNFFQEQGELALRSIFSHLAASDDPEQESFTRTQIQRFGELAAQVRNAPGIAPFFHLLNTSGIFNYPDAQWDLVRSGIGLYGYSNNPETDPLLRPVARLKTRISQIHEVRAGEWVGYNRGYVARETRRIATLPVGHADGIGRIYGQGAGQVRIQGQAVPVIGNVCMDMTMVDVTDTSCREGDEAVFFGGGTSAETLAERAGTISYELLAGISQRVARRILE